MHKSKKRRVNSSTFFILALFSVALYYYSFRYIFKYNSEGTSPTYSETPAILKYFKYVLVLGIYGCFILIERIPKTKVIPKSGALALTLLFSFNIMIVVKMMIGIEVEYIKLLIVSVFPIMFCLSESLHVDYGKVSRFLYKFYLFAIIYESFQIVLFLIWGRLPALAFENSILVRFGGPWDDPNGWGVALSFFIPFVYYYNTTYRKKLLFAGLAMLIATQSVTVVVSFVLTLFSYKYLLFKRYRIRYIVLGLLFLLSFLLIVNQLLSVGFVSDYMELKQGSVEGHAESLGIFENIEWYEILFGRELYVGNESDFSNIFVIGGVILLILYVALMVVSILRMLELVRKNVYPMSLWRGALFFQLSYFFSSINLPCSKMFYLFYMFNIFLVLSLFSGLSISGNKKEFLNIASNETTD